MSLWDIIVWPFARLMEFLYNTSSNYGVAVILFAFVVNIVMAPFMAKSKKSMMRTTRLQPRIQEIQRRHEGNKNKLNEEMSKLYREEKINPMSGCLWTLIPFPILIALYSVIRQPLGRMMGIAKESVEEIKEWVTENLGFIASQQGTYDEIRVTDLIHKNWDSFVSALGDFGGKLIDLDYSFLGLNLGDIPDYKLWELDWSDASVFLPGLGLFLIPIIAAALSYFSMKISQKTNPQPAAAGNAGASMKSMNIVMPIMSIWICFMMPAALGVYWIANSIFGMGRDIILTRIYKKKLDEEDAERIAREKEREKDLQRKREETERMRAEGSTTVNSNTSKKKLQAQQKQESDERRAAAEKEERTARRERLGVEEAAAPASQVGNRRYARGRAYDPDRYKTSEITEEASTETTGEN